LSLVSSKSKKVFLSLDSKIEVDSKVDIILSPEFYWVRIFDIPVKSITQARHVLPTLFEDILENVRELSFQVIKLEENKYLCFAYINKKIYEHIKKSGVNLSLVNAVYFAQNECNGIEQFIVNDKSYVYTPDGILVKVPNAIATNAVNLDEKIDSIELSSNKIDIKLYNNVLTSKQIYSIIAVFLIISAINFYKLFDYKNEIKQLDEKIEKTRKSSNLPSSSLQTNSILKKYKKNVSFEAKKREAISYLLSNKKNRLKSFELENNILTLKYANANKNQVERFISLKYKIESSRVNALELNIKVKL